MDPGSDTSLCAPTTPILPILTCSPALGHRTQQSCSQTCVPGALWPEPRQHRCQDRTRTTAPLLGFPQLGPQMNHTVSLEGHDCTVWSARRSVPVRQLHTACPIPEKQSLQSEMLYDEEADPFICWPSSSVNNYDLAIVSVLH